MNEIEQLRADIATLEAALEVTQRKGWCYPKLEYELSLDKTKLSRLEAETAEKADPWLNVKADVKYLNDVGGNSGIHIMARYARHLEQRVAELAQRPVVYVLRRKKTGKVETWRSHGGGEIPVIYLPCEVKWRQETVREELDDYAFEPYTGQHQ